ncbi:response regulator transcription factor [Paenibacillus terrigena]|uniref:response regulator transcription factor n=1 Tax=Paenibacillus terrigena TaxID=369333 RepID=UPI0028D573B0|nr:response regulator transcription factor [Paenibacillus terrigena]
MNILIVEDDDSIRNVLQSYLINEGWTVHTSEDGNDALQKIYNFKFDLLLLDLMIPGVSGEEICKQIRKFSNIPIIMITSKAQEMDTINGLNLGADDYITKPFRMKEVIARIRVIQRRMNMFSVNNQTVMRFNRGNLVINFESKEVYVNSKPANLTITEFKLLSVLVKNPNKLYTRQELSYEVQGYRDIGDGRTTDTHIKNIRKKIEEDHKNPVYIVTKIGGGYKFSYHSDEGF